MKAAKSLILVLIALVLTCLVFGCTAQIGTSESAGTKGEDRTSEVPTVVTMRGGRSSEYPVVWSSEYKSTLSLSLTSDKAVYILGEPIVLSATLTNLGEEPIEIVPIFDPTYGFAGYSIIYPNGDTQQFAPIWHDEGIAIPYKLGAGQSVSDAVRLYFGAAGFTFLQQGNYIVRGYYGGIISEPLTISVNLSQDDMEIAAADLMLNDEVGLFIFAGGGEHLKEALNILNMIRQEFPETLLAGYASFALGVYYSQDGRNFEDNTVRQADHDLAQKLFEEALKKPLPSYFKIHTYSRLIRSFVSVGEPASAGDYLKLFQNEFEGEPLAVIPLSQAQKIIEKSR